MSGDCDKIPCPTCEPAEYEPTRSEALERLGNRISNRLAEIRDALREAQDREDARALAQMATRFYAAETYGRQHSAAIDGASNMLHLARQAVKEPQP